MREKKDGWKPKDFERLYRGLGGFDVIEGEKHTKYRHPKYPRLWTMVKRTTPLSKAYAEDAVELLDELRGLEEQQQW